jgi:putative transposase
MKYDPNIHHRHSIRLPTYDYSQPGVYFITVCAQNREYLFGEITDCKMQLNNAGRIAEKCWQEIPKHYPDFTLDKFIIMPNHVHGILFVKNPPVGANNHSPSLNNHSPSLNNHSPSLNNHLTDNHWCDNSSRAKNFSPLRGCRPRRDPIQTCPTGTSKTIGSVVRGYKIGVTKWFRQNTNVYSVWQRNYWERIIRDETELEKIREYIKNNPKQWESDKLFVK